MLRAAGWAVNVKRVERIWRLEGLKVPSRFYAPRLAGVTQGIDLL